jgi:hypothetical protein
MAGPQSDERLPQYFYKYRSLNSPERIEQILLEDTLYFPRVREFNDPFDCAPVPHIRASIQEQRRYFRDIAKQGMPGARRTERRLWIKSLPKDRKSLIEAQREVLSQVANEAGIFSLSEKNDDVLMWSHYADSHRGICLRFSVDARYFQRAWQVLYRRERPAIDLLFDTRDEMVEKALLVKADYWSYEKEWRIIEHERGPGCHKFPPQLLDGVIIGSLVSQTNREMMLAWLKKRQVPTGVMQAHLHPDLFRIEVKEL